jgi:hypothetical protein
MVSRRKNNTICPHMEIDKSQHLNNSNTLSNVVTIDGGLT